MKRAKSVKSEEERHELISELKDYDLYDYRHPFFVEGSPFFMNKTDDEFMEVITPVEAFNEDNFALLELSALKDRK